MTPSSEAGMVIVGAGECGLRAAMSLRENGCTTPVTLVGAEIHLPYERPPLTKDATAAGESLEPKAVASREVLDTQEIVLITGAEAVALDRKAKTVSLSNGAEIPYRKLLLTTGARPRRLPIAEGRGRCVYLRTFEEAQSLVAHLKRRVRIAVIGGGFIGLELAAMAVGLGCSVTVIESQTRLLMRAVPAEIASVIEREHRSHGVDIRLGHGVAAIMETTSGVEIALANAHVVDAELCVIGIGAVPNVELADAAGLRIDNGIAVDAELRTSDPDIFAAGDCCSFPHPLYGDRRLRLEAWRNAQQQGTLAAANMLGERQKQCAAPWFWSDQYGLGLQIAGLCDAGSQVVRRDLSADSFILFHLAEDGRLVAAAGIGPGNAVARDIRLAEMLIERRAAPGERELAASDIKLKALLAA